MAAAEEENDPVAEAPEAPATGVHAVFVTSIDKLTTDSDLAEHFAGPDKEQSDVVKLEQFTNPKHSARIDLRDQECVGRALNLNNSKLHRRTLKVAAWEDSFSESIESMTPYERSLTGAQKEVGERPKLNLKPRSLPVDPESPKKRSIGGKDPYAGAPMQSAPVQPRGAADMDENWRARPPVSNGKKSKKAAQSWNPLEWCCRRARRD